MSECLCWESGYHLGMDRRTIEWAKKHLQDKAAKDPAFRELLLSDPRGAVQQEFGMELPPEIDIQAFNETATSIYLVLAPPPPGRDSVVTLREVNGENVRTVCALKVKDDQNEFVAPNAFSLAESKYAPNAWVRAIYADDTPVGFVMLSDDAETPRYYVWRYMVAGEYQGLGFGRKAMEQLIEYVRTRPSATELLLSYVPGEGSPQEFYTKLGFKDTGEQHGGENVMKLEL